MSFEFIEWQRDDGVGRLTLNRPPLNIFNIAMIRELNAALEEAARDDSLRVLVVRAEGKMFSAGVDVADHTADKVGEMIPLVDQAFSALAHFPSPTLAIVHGHALGGGCEVALCCDLILAAEGADFGQPEIKLAAVAPVAAMVLPQLIGYRRAAEMLFTGEAIRAPDAARIGLISRAVPAAELASTADALIAKLNGLSAPALRLCKQALRLGGSGWAGQSSIEKLYLEELMLTADAHEGLAAFMEKRPPSWTHR